MTTTDRQPSRPMDSAVTVFFDTFQNNGTTKKRHIETGKLWFTPIGITWDVTDESAVFFPWHAIIRIEGTKVALASIGRKGN